MNDCKDKNHLSARFDESSLWLNYCSIVKVELLMQTKIRKSIGSLVANEEEAVSAIMYKSEFLNSIF